tara:strand:- start:1104 stop:1661 length:558 start_codon:yes stop_codon:yes gene_type:complete
MALFGRDPVYTKVPTGLHPYDLAAEDSAEQIRAARRQSEDRPIYGAGGIQGAALRQRGEMEGAFMNASVQAIEQRRAQERARLQREAAIREQRRMMVQRQEMQNLSNVVSGIAGVGADITSQVEGLSGRRMTNSVLGGQEATQDMIDLGLIRVRGGSEEDPLYGYTAKGGAKEFFSQPYWGGGGS